MNTKFPRSAKCFLLLMASAVFTPLALAQDSPGSPATLHSPLTGRVVLLQSDQSTACGTGVILDSSRVLTADHLIAKLCPLNSCLGVRVRVADQVGGYPNRQLTTGAAQIEMRNQVLDLAVLQFAADNFISDQTSAASAKPIWAQATLSDEVKLLSYPQCQELRVELGAITELTPLQIRTTAKGNFGSSGGVFVNGAGKIVGIAQTSADLSGALLGSSLGLNFRAAGLRSELVELALESVGSASSCFTPYSSQLLAEARGLQYKSGLDRFLRSSSYIARINKIPECVRFAVRDGSNSSNSPQLGSTLSSLVSTPTDLFTAVLNQSLSEAQANQIANLELLIFAALLEYRGARTNLSTEGERSQFFNYLRSQNRPQTQIDQITDYLELFIQSGFPGVQRSIAVLALISALFSVMFALVWGASAGFIFARVQGGVLKRAAKTLFLQLFFWPISLILFVTLGIKRARMARKS